MVEPEWPSNAWLTYADVTKRWGLQTDPKTRNYIAVNPDTITLPRAEVEALMEAARAAWDEACANHEKAPPIKYLAPYGGLVRLHTALAALQERMK